MTQLLTPPTFAQTTPHNSVPGRGDDSGAMRYRARRLPERVAIGFAAVLFLLAVLAFSVAARATEPGLAARPSSACQDGLCVVLEGEVLDVVQISVSANSLARPDSEFSREVLGLGLSSGETIRLDCSRRCSGLAVGDRVTVAARIYAVGQGGEDLRLFALSVSHQ